jgi:hypothetical protein
MESNDNFHPNRKIMKTTILFTISLVFHSLICLSQSIDPSEQLINSTIQIISQRTVTQNGVTKQYQITGTGFYFTFKTPKGDIPIIVTNRHVVEGVSAQQLNFKQKKADGNPDYNSIIQVGLLPNDAKWIFHPDAKVDLAILPIAPIINHYEKLGKKISYVTLDESLIPSDSVRNTLLAIEDILMIGYPFGLRDKGNDLPIVRRGITATPFYIDYNKQKEFLCDIPVYPGSSGSPILIFNQQSYTIRNGNTMFAKRAYLLGINYATYTNDFEGKVTPIQAFFNGNNITTAIPYNIAIVIKSERILEFKPLLLKLSGL